MEQLSQLQQQVLTAPIILADEVFGSLQDRIKAAEVIKPNDDKREQYMRQIISGLKQQPDDYYGDVFNKMICQNLDMLIAQEAGVADFGSLARPDVKAAEARIRERTGAKALLRYSQEMIEAEILGNISPDTLIDYELGCLVDEAVDYAQVFASLSNSELDPMDIERFSSLWLIFNTMQEYQMPGWSRVELRKQLAESVFLGRDFNLVTLVCMSYVHEADSEPGTARVNSGPLVKLEGRDNDDIEALEKFGTSAEILRTFLGEKVKPYAVLSDIDFTEVFRVDDPRALEDAKIYYANYEQTAAALGLIPLSFSQLLTEPEIGDAFEESLVDIRTNIEAAAVTNWFGDPRFYVNYPYLQKQAVSIFEYYNSLPGVSMRWQVALQNTIDKFAVYGSQPEVLRKKFGSNFIFMSSEFPVRDQMYNSRDRKLKQPLLPVVYSINKLVV